MELPVLLMALCPSVGAPAHWRQRKQQGCGGAFEGLGVAFLGRVPPPLDDEALATIVRAGGGTPLHAKGAGAVQALQVGCSKAGRAQLVRRWGPEKLRRATIVCKAVAMQSTAGTQVGPREAEEGHKSVQSSS